DVPGGRVMAGSTTRRGLLRRLATSGAFGVFAAAMTVAGVLAVLPADAQQRREILSYPKRPGEADKKKQTINPANIKNSKEQMLVRADEVNYDYTNERVSAIGNVQIYYSDNTLEADRVIYDQKTKRLHAEGNVRLKEADGRIVFGEILDLSDDF